MTAANAPSEPRPAVQLRDVRFAYGRETVLHGVDLEVPRGSFAAVIGPNGGGKSTLLKLVVGELSPSSGEVRLLGEAPGRSCRRVGYLPQNDHLDPEFPITVAEVVGHGRLSGGWRLGGLGRRDREIVRRSLEDVGCADLADRSYRALSGGQQRRVLIARALATEPEMLALDEPAAGLDPTSQHELYDLLSSLAERLTVLVVSHHVNLVSSHVDLVVCVHDGHLHLPSTEEIAPELEDFFPDTRSMVLVRHEHHDCPAPEHRHD
ncbi:ATP-binding cassette domain-containing protein [bacterium]|nr:ATP-binding cassette domain-containing protein [bacterium]